MRHDAINSLDNPFWQYSIKVYRNSEFEEILLQGQLLGLDVNLLLFCGYLTSHGRSLSSITDKLWPIDHWQVHTVQPIRELRKRVKALNKDWYDEIKSLELEAEQIEQALLYDVSNHASVAEIPNLLSTNLNAYLQYKAIHPQKKWLQALSEHLQPS